MKNTRLLTGLTITMVIVFIFLFTLIGRKGPTVIDDKTVFSPPKKIELIVVEEGESLSVIGYRIGVPWQYLAKLNDMENPSFIREGQTLKVPAVPEEE